MQKLLSAAAVTLALAFSGMALAHEQGQESWQEHPHCEKAASVLPQDKREMFHSTMKQAMEENKASMEQEHKLRGELHAILTAPEFDKKAFLAKSEEMQKLHEKMHRVMTEAVASAFGQLSQEERTRVAEEMQRMHGHMHHLRHKPKDADAQAH